MLLAITSFKLVTRPIDFSIDQIEFGTSMVLFTFWSGTRFLENRLSDWDEISWDSGMISYLDYGFWHWLGSIWAFKSPLHFHQFILDFVLKPYIQTWNLENRNLEYGTIDRPNHWACDNNGDSSRIKKPLPSALIVCFITETVWKSYFARYCCSSGVQGFCIICYKKYSKLTSNYFLITILFS